MLELIKKLLLQIIKDIDTGNSNLTEEEQLKAIEEINNFTRKDIGLSKYQAYTYLNMSRSNFDRLIKEGKIPKGKKINGFKELRWYKKDLNKVKQY